MKSLPSETGVRGRGARTGLELRRVTGATGRGQNLTLHGDLATGGPAQRVGGFKQLEKQPVRHMDGGGGVFTDDEHADRIAPLEMKDAHGDLIHLNFG